MSSLFRDSEVEQVEKDFEKITLAPEQRGIVEGIAKIMAQFVPISEIALRGFIWKAITEWQVNSNRTLDELSTSEPKERLEVVKIMFTSAEKDLKKVLRNKSDESTITNAIEKGFNYYKNSFSER